MKEHINKSESEIVDRFANEIGGVIIGICRACGGERVIDVGNNKLINILPLLNNLHTQICNSKNPHDTWSLLEGYMWDFSHLEDI